MEINSVKDVEKMTEMDIHLPDMALPVQMKQNKAILGRISVTNLPIGSRGGEGVTEYEIAVNSSVPMVVSNSDVCLDLTVGQKGATVRTGTNNIFEGAQTLFKSVNGSLGNQKLCDLQNYADRVADFHVKSTHTNDELDYLHSTAGYGVEFPTGENVSKTISVRIPLKWFGLDFGNLLPTDKIGSTFRINLTLNDKTEKMFSGLTAGENKITISNLRLETEFIELQNVVSSKRLELIRSATGLTIPYHAYAVDARSLRSTSELNERISMNYNNVVSLYQLPYGVETNLTAGYYKSLKWGDTIDMNEITNYRVNFAGRLYFNLNSSSGQSGKASHAKALMDTLRTENTIQGAGSGIVKGIDNYQVLSVNFVRANNVLSPAIIDSGVNARVLNSQVETQASFGTKATTENLSMTSIIKYTQRIIMQGKGLSVYS